MVEQEGQSGFICRKCGNWYGDELYQAHIAVSTKWDNWCFDCFLIHRYGGGRLRPKKRNAKILLGLAQGRTQQEVADMFMVSKPRINQILKKNIPWALNKSAS